MDRQLLLRRAEEHIFSTGLDDSGARLGLANMKYGLAKVHLAQEALGLAPDATFITAPDLTVTRNHHRWRSGFGYGGRLTWGDGQQELIILDLKPNCCGMLVGGLDDLPALCRFNTTSAPSARLMMAWLNASVRSAGSAGVKARAMSRSLPGVKRVSAA